ncbi:MAG: TrbC/VirB2 family protein [Elusimicrobia bacterium]|nr:TrbC/VirB2 family protein [Elusimicrobiota bacterium]
MKKNMQNNLMTAGLLLMTAAPAFAQYGGNDAQVGSFLTSTANWMVTVLGPGIFIIGVIMVGISLAMGDQDAMRRGGYVIGGGALIFLSQSVVALLRKLAGV